MAPDYNTLPTYRKKFSHVAGYFGNCRFRCRRRNEVMNTSNDCLKLILGQPIYTAARQGGPDNLITVERKGNYDT
jgi:hypothetical protein